MTPFMKIDTSKMDRALNSLGTKTPKVVQQALNRTIRGVQTVMKRAISKDIGIKVGVVAEGMKISKATPTRARAILRVTGKRIPLIKLGAKASRKGVSYRLGGQRRRIADAFIAKMPGGHIGVFRRVGRARLAIIELFGPSIVNVFRKCLPKGQARAKEQLPKEMASAMRKAAARGSS